MATLSDTMAGLAPTASNSASASNVTMNDLVSLDPRVIFNKLIYQYLALFGLYWFDLDTMIFSPGDGVAAQAGKSAALNVGIDMAASQLRRSFPMIQL